MLVSSYITPKARKGAVSIQGRGLIAVAPITAGAYGPGAAYLPVGLRRDDGRLAGPRRFR